MDISTNYLGLTLKNPLVPSSSPISKTLDGVKSLEDAGAPAIVLHSLFEEQIEHESGELLHYLSSNSDSYAEALNYFPDLENYNLGPEEYLSYISKIKSETNIPVIASLNGSSSGGWMRYARLIEQAGADALELNIYFVAADCSKESSEIEKLYIENLSFIKSEVSIPVAMKLAPYFTSLGNMAKKLDDTRADGLVLFNRFYQPDFDLETLEVVPNLKLSTNFEMRLPLRWVAILYGKINASLAITSGVQNHEDLIKSIMAGADVAMICSEILRKGPGRMKEILLDLQNWMEVNEYESVDQMKGSMSQKSVSNPEAFERANYMKVLDSYK